MKIKVPTVRFFSIQLNKGDRRIIFANLFVVVLLLGFLFYQSSSEDSGIVIGTTKETAGTAERRQKVHSFYGSLARNHSVFDGDIIRTGNDSEARIEIQNGAILYLRQNTIVTLHFKDRKLNVNLAQGHARLIADESAGESKISNSTATAELQGEGETAQEGDAFSMWLFSGRARINHGNQTVELKPGESKVASKGNITVESAPPPPPPSFLASRLFLPRDGETFQYSEKTPIVEFAWSRGAAGPVYKILVSRDESFKDVLVNKISRASGAAATIPAGNYYWKVQQIIGAGISESVARKFTVVQIAKPNPPTTVRPPENMEFDSEILEKEGVMFNWSANPDVEETEFAISESEKSNKKYQAKTGANYLIVKAKLEPGEYQWQIKSRAGTKTSDPSAPRKFTVTGSGEGAPPVYPLPGSSVDMAGTDRLTFKWKATKAKTYKFRLFHKQANGYVLVDEATVNAAEYSLTDLSKLDVGSFKWTVVDANAKRAKESSTEFQIVLEEAKEKTQLKK